VTARPETIEGVLDELDGDPARIAVAMAGRTPEALLKPLEPGGWSARDILGHIRACDRTWGGYMVRILDEDHPSIRGESPRGTIRRTDFLERPFSEQLESFVADRADLIQRLHAAGDEGLARTAAVRFPGRTAADYSVTYFLHRLADHEREHVRYLERVPASS
jgi:hypothetical protein